MLKPPTAFSSLEGLLDLDRHDGIDMRPTLLRVLTDLYLQKRTHPPEDERYYTELALRLIDATDLPARKALAARLAPYPAAPRAVIARLARDVLEVAEPILTQSPLPHARRPQGHRRGARADLRGDHCDPRPARPADRAREPRAHASKRLPRIGGGRALRAVLRGGRGRSGA